MGATHTCITVHGGWWTENDKSFGEYKAGVVPLKYNQPEALVDLHENGYAVFDLNYQLAKGIPKNGSNPTSYPEQNKEVIEAVEYLEANWAAMGLPNPKAVGGGVFLVGGSAGGNIALLAAQEISKTKPGCLKGVASLSGPCDLVAWDEGAAKGTGEEGVHGRLCATSNCANRVEPSETPCKEKMEARSPVKKINVATDPPYYVCGFVTDQVPWPENGKRMVEALTLAGCSVHEKLVAGSGHSFKQWTKYNTDLYTWMTEHA